MNKYNLSWVKETQIQKHSDIKNVFTPPLSRQDKLFTLIGQLIKQTMDKKLFSYRPMIFFHPRLTVVRKYVER